MSRENVALVQQAAETWNRGDLDALFEIYDPDIELDNSRYEGWPDEASLRGRDAVRGFLEQWRNTFSDYRYDVEQYVDAGDRVVALCSQGGAGRDSSGIAMMRWAQVATVRHGRILRLENYSDREEALAAAGVPK